MVYCVIKIIQYNNTHSFYFLQTTYYYQLEIFSCTQLHCLNTAILTQHKLFLMQSISNKLNKNKKGATSFVYTYAIVVTETPSV
jgi:hypothetical protein